MHENLSRHHTRLSASPRAFGLLLATALAFFALHPLLEREGPRWTLLALATLALVLAVIVPSVYAIPNRAWTLLGATLARLTSPVALVVLFYGVFTPIGWLMRAARRNALRLGYDAEAHTYWIERNPPGPDGPSLKHLF